MIFTFGCPASVRIVCNPGEGPSVPVDRDGTCSLVDVLVSAVSVSGVDSRQTIETCICEKLDKESHWKVED